MIQFTDMNMDDLEKISQIEKCCFNIPWSYQMLLEELRNSLAHYKVIKYSGSTVGYAGMWFVCDEAHITNIAIDPEFQNKGFGKKLLKYMIEESLLNGMTKMTLEVRGSNLAAMNLYKKFGFVVGGIRKNYYEDNHEDALIMWREL